MNKVYEFKKTQKATVTLTDDAILIKKHSHFQKLKGENRIPFTSISSVQFREAKFTVNGMLRFTITGNSTFRGSLADDNTILFLKKDADNIIEIHNYIQDKISNKQSATASNATDEIRKYKALMDDGIISKEEFEEKKKQLLGL